MLKKVNKFMWMSVICSLFFLVMGILLLINPEMSIRTISVVLAILLITSGILLIVDYSGRILFNNFLILGFISLLFGILLLVNPNILVMLIPITIGVWMVINAAINMQISLGLKKCGYNYWLLSFALSILSIFCGIMMVINPESSSLILTALVGVLLIIYSISDIVNLLIFKNNITKVVKLLEK